MPVGSDNRKSRPWRTVYVAPHSLLEVEDERMKITHGEEITFLPLMQVRTVIITSHTGMISFPLLNRLAEQKSSVIFCTKKHVPAAALYTLSGAVESAGRTMDQAGWTARKKQSLWRQIVMMKIRMQMSLLQRIGCEVPDAMKACAQFVEPGDTTNREAVAARVYFDQLFGKEFIRHHEDDTNAALNYGYAIVRSTLCQAIAAHGYSSALGIHHNSRVNNTNFACDLMEPFRPFVDEIVWQSRGRAFDREVQLNLVQVLYRDCLLGGKHMTVQTALDEFVLDVLDAMRETRYNIKEVSFAGEA